MHWFTLVLGNQKPFHPEYVKYRGVIQPCNYLVCIFYQMLCLFSSTLIGCCINGFDQIPGHESHLAHPPGMRPSNCKMKARHVPNCGGWHEDIYTWRKSSLVFGILYAFRCLLYVFFSFSWKSRSAGAACPSSLATPTGLAGGSCEEEVLLPVAEPPAWVTRKNSTYFLICFGGVHHQKNA